MQLSLLKVLGQVLTIDYIREMNQLSKRERSIVQLIDFIKSKMDNENTFFIKCVFLTSNFHHNIFI